MNWGEIIKTLFLDLIITVFGYLLVPIIFCIRDYPLYEREIKKIITINAVCVCIVFTIIQSCLGNVRPSGAVFLWSWVGYIIMKKRLYTRYYEKETKITPKTQNTPSNEQPNIIANNNDTPISPKEKITNAIASKRIAAVLSILLCVILYLSFLTTVFTNKRDTYICYTTKTGECFHSAICQYASKTAYETTVYEACRDYKPCSYCNPCAEQYKTTITERNFIIPFFISAPISAVVFLLMTYKRRF